MKIHIVGGGPAGLYFAILMKHAWPENQVAVFERNRPDDTFGFGVVFSAETLSTLERYDRESYRAITNNFAYWDDIEIHFKDLVQRVGGNGFCGCSLMTLLTLLQQRAHALGVELRFETEVASDLAAHGDADLIVAADGANSAIRARYQEHFGSKVDFRPNKFAWMGSTRSFDAFSFFFRETEYGIFIAHCYQYEPNRSTWIMEVQPETFRNAGLDQLDELQSAQLLEGVFAKELQGHRLLVNRSMWRNFPRVSNERWVKDNIVLMGDAKATAHFSIGSGTKLAMEDAGALFDSFRAVGGRDVAKALVHFETTRREEVEKTQHAADVSLVWFEHIDRFWDMDPSRFAFEGDHLRQSPPARAGIRRRDRPRLRPRGAQPGFRRQCCESDGADVPAISSARHDHRQSRRRFPDVPILGSRRHAGRLAPRALRRARDWRRWTHVHRNDRCIARRAHLARLCRHVFGRPRGCLEAHR
jgi:anthraniloyl-CoA monooxygenase